MAHDLYIAASHRRESHEAFMVLSCAAQPHTESHEDQLVFMTLSGAEEFRYYDPSKPWLFLC